MDIEEAKRFCQIGINKGFFGVEAVRESLAALRQRMAAEGDASIQAILVEKGFLKPSQAMDILRDMVSSPAPADAGPELEPEPPPAPEPEIQYVSEPAGSGEEESEDPGSSEFQTAHEYPASDLEEAASTPEPAPSSYSRYEEAIEGGMTLDAEQLSESMEMFAISEEDEPPAYRDAAPDPPPEDEVAPEPPFEPPVEEPPASEEPPVEEPPVEEPPVEEPPAEPELPEEAPPVEEPVAAAPSPAPVATPSVQEKIVTPESTTRRETAPGSSEAMAAAGTAREAIGRATQGSLLTADDFFRCLNMAFQKEKLLYTAGTFVLIAVVGAILTKLGSMTESSFWFVVSQALTLVFGLVAFLGLTGVLARSANGELDGEAPLGPSAAATYLKTNWLALLASPAIFLVGLALATTLSVGLLYLIGHIPYAGPILFGLTTLVVFGILLAAFVLGFLGLLVIPAAVAVEEKDPVGTVRSVWDRVRQRPVPLLFTEVLAFLFISIVTFALGTVVAVPFETTNQLESRVQDTPAVTFIFRTPASEAVTDVAGTTAGETEAAEEKGSFEKFCYFLGQGLFRLSMYIILAAVLTVPYIFIAVLQVPAYRSLIY